RTIPHVRLERDARASCGLANSEAAGCRDCRVGRSCIERVDRQRSAEQSCARRNGINADATYDRRTEIRTPAELQIVLGDRLVDVVDREPAVEVARGFERIPRQIER